MQRFHSELLDYEEEQAKCQGCNGHCWREGTSRGMVTVVTIDNDTCHFAVKVCDHERQRRQQERAKQLVKSAKIPAAYAHDTLANYPPAKDNTKAVQAARRFLGGEYTGLYIAGPQGTGKTKLAAAIANERLRQGKPVLFVSAPELLADIRATFGRGDTEATVYAIKNAPCLVLDDLGAERMTQWVGEQLFAIVNYRHNEELPTVITSNHAITQLAAHMATVDRAGNVIDDAQGRRITSRIVGMCHIVWIGGRDYRRVQHE